MFFKICVLKKFAIFTRKHLWWNLFLIHLQFSSPATISKSNSSTSVFLWTLPNLKNFLKTFVNSCFWNLMKVLFDHMKYYHSELVMKTYFMCILLSDCTNTFVIRLKNRRAKSDCPYGSTNNLVWHFKKWDPQCKKRKSSSQSWSCQLDEGHRLLEINCILYTWNGVSNKLLWFSWSNYMVAK